MNNAIVKKFGMVMASAMMIVGCGSVTQTSSTATNADDSDTIVVGGNFELTGAVAAYGNDISNGAKLAVEEINANGGVNGKQLTYVEADNKSDSNESAATATRLIDEEGASVIIGPSTTANFEAQVNPAETAKVPFIGPAVTSDGATTDENGDAYDYGFSVAFLNSFQGGAIARFANDKGFQKAAVLQDNSADYGQTLASEFTDAFEGQVVSTESYVSGDSDFSAILTNIKGQNPDVIFIAGYYTEAGTIIKQAREMGIEAAIVGPDGFGSEELSALAGEDNMNDIYYVSHFATGEDAPQAAQDFSADFEETYGKAPDAYAALGYDAVNIYAAAVEAAGTTETTAVAEAIAATTDFEGITGTITMKDDHTPNKTASIQEIQQNEVVGSTAVAPE
ncbi:MULTISPECIES: ABC transporter substrate-binding protein [Aerococcus]|jgi:branched-chain amino acid transport system substrate-binding protein|uniref:ABC transporter substrate-binding protein n=1 Tax=Aerococcus agrisoli TaxID=2487350 RepID=A0A3N4GVN4_9LACT|nr:MULTISPECIES: ABC transporter substrate-binding protein [Aerococcus]OYQ67524.1 branched-chain amino acid ABC transporter substrate-binding protein [Aerococcus sp. 1KP-2016]RPA65507.1 ABC transporter substrate-binding protein [Aerococcus agrisoli]